MHGGVAIDEAGNLNNVFGELKARMAIGISHRLEYMYKDEGNNDTPWTDFDPLSIALVVWDESEGKALSYKI